MDDIIVIESLRKRGWLQRPYEELLPYYTPERKARFLDKEPKRLSFMRVNLLDPCGTMQKFSLIYQQMQASNTAIEIGTIDLNGQKKFCDPEIFITLQTLISMSTGKSLDLIRAAADLVRLILTADADTITKNVLRKTIDTYIPMNYYSGELINGIEVSVFNTSKVALYWKSMCEFAGYYTECIPLGMELIESNCVNEKEVREFCKKKYAEAKESKDFMSRLYKKGANKYLASVLYCLYDKHPELLNVTVPNSGFAEEVQDDTE